MLAAVTLAGAWGARTWQATLLREAYLPELEARAKRRPFDGPVLALLGGRLAEAREFAAASESLRRAIAAGDGDAAVWLTWAAATAAQGRQEEAVAALRLGMRDPAREPTLAAAVDRCRALPPGPSPEALAAAVCPQGTWLLVGARTQGSCLNSLAEWLGRRNPARSGFATRERWAREAPASVRAQALWGAALLRNRRYADAERTFRHALELGPKTPELHSGLGHALLHQGVTAKAGLEYMAALRLRRDYPRALLGLGGVALEKKLLPIALDCYQRATRIAPGNADAWMGLGRAFYNQRLRWGESLAAFEQAARLAPARTDYFADYANALRANFRHAEAEAVLRRRLKAAPEDAQSHYLLALVLLEHRPGAVRQAEAEASLRASLALQPEVAVTLERLGRLLLGRGQAREAMPLLEGALRGDPYRVAAQMALARAYRRLGRRREADVAQKRLAALSDYTQRIAFLEDQIQRQPLNLAAHRELARAYQQGGEREKAERQREMAYMLEHHRQAASRGITALKEATSTARPAEGNR